MNFGPGSGLTINLSDSQVDLSLSQITETIIDTYYNDDDYSLEKSEEVNQEIYAESKIPLEIDNLVLNETELLCSLDNELQILKEINYNMNKSLINTDVNLNKLVESTASVDEEIIKEQNEEIKKVEQELNELKKMMNEVNKIVVINREDLEAVEQTVDKVEVNVDTGVEELREASTYVNWLTHKNTKIAGAATVVGLATGGIGYLFGAGAIVASGIALATGAATGAGTNVALKSVSQKLSF